MKLIRPKCQNFLLLTLLFIFVFQLSANAFATENIGKEFADRPYKKTLDEIFNSNLKKSQSSAINADSVLEDIRSRLSLPNATWIQDSVTGCKVLNPFPKDNETVRFTGLCKAGFANGEGKVEWFEDGKPKGVSVSTWINGLENGHAVHTWPGGTFDGNYVNGMRQGHAKVFLKSGSQFIGEFKDDKRYGHIVIVRSDGVRLEGEIYQDKFMGYAPPMLDGNTIGYGSNVYDFFKIKLNNLIKKISNGYDRNGILVSLLTLCTGLIVGSFLTNLTNRNTLINNIKNKGETPHFSYLKPLGYCPTCGTRLTWRNMIPIASYLLQKGRCHKCNAKIGIRYPIVEIITASTLLLISCLWSAPLLVVVHCSCSCLMICIGIIGYREFEIPKYLNYILISFGLLTSALKINSVPTEDAILGGAFGYLIPYLYNLSYSRQHWNSNLIEPSNFLLLSAVGVWVGPIYITGIAIISLIFQGLASTLYANREFKVLDYHKSLACALGLIAIFVRQ